MGDGRKIQYLIELLPDTKQFEKIREKMKAIDGGEFIKFEPNEVKKLKGILQGVVDDVGNRASSIGTKIQQGIASGIDKGKLQKMLDLDTSKLRETMEIVEALTGLIDDHSKGSSWLKDGKGFLSKLSGSQQDLRNLEQSISQLELKFEGLDASLTSTIEKFDTLATAIRTLQDNGKPIVVSPINITTGTKQVQQFEKEIDDLNALLVDVSDKEIKIDTTNVIRDFHKLAKEADKLSEEIDDLIYEADASDNKDDERSLMMQVAQKKTQLAKMYREMNAMNQHYQKSHSDTSLSLFDEEGVFEDPKDIIKQAKEYIEYVIRELSHATKEKATKSDNAIGVEIALPSVDDIKKKLNDVIDQLNKPNSLHKIKLEIGDVANVIKDKDKRQYGDNEAIEDVNTENLIKKTDERFIKISKTIGKKQKGILRNTEEWRKKMIKAMQIGKDDLNFQFGWDGHLKESADSLFNKLQEYFEQPEYALDIHFDTEKIAKNLKASLEAEGIELGVGGGTASIDAKSLMSMLHSILYGGALVRTTTQASVTSGGSIQKEVADETDDAADSSKEYVKVLDETTLHIDKVIESLRTFAKEANKYNASKGSKAIAERLAGKGIDISKITKDTSDAQILKMLQDGLMAKDEMGKPQGGSLAAEIRTIMSTNGMDAKKGAGKVAELLAFHITELFDINEIETELEMQVEKRFKQLNLWQGIEKPGRAFAALGKVRSTKDKVRLPEMQVIDDAISYFEDAGEDTDALKKLKEARKNFEDSGQTDEAKAEFEKAALVFYDETTDVFKRLKSRWGDFRGTVSVEGRHPILINPKGAYPTRILEIPKDAVITKVEPFEAFEVVDDIGLVGSSNRRESSVRKAEQEQKKLNYGASGYDFLTQKPTPKKDIRYEEIEYDTFKTQESGRLPQEVALDATIESLEKRVAEIPELVERIDEGKKNIVQLEEIKHQIESEISNLQVQDLPEFQMNAFEQYSKRNRSTTEILRNANKALTTNDVLDAGDVSKLDNEQQSLVGRLKTLTTNIHNDSKASQEFADKIAEIVEAKKLSKEELEIARSNATQQGDKVRADLYRDLLFDSSSIDSRLESYRSQKNVADKNIGQNKKYAQKLITELAASRDQSADKATKEAETLAAQLIEAKERLYAEAKTYANILNDSSADEKTREIALGKLQETLRGLNQITGKFATIQAYVPQSTLYNSSQQNNVDKWNQKYTNSEVRKLEKELKGLEEQLKTEEDEAKIAKLKQKIANTKRNLTRLKKSVPDNVSNKKHTELGNIERQLSEERSKLVADENRKNAADKASKDLQYTKQDAAFLTKYNELLEKEKSLLEEVNRLKREGADKSVIDNKTDELKQATMALDDFLKKEKTAERTAYAREAAVEYQAQLHTAYRKRSVFDNQIQGLDEDESNLTKYGLSGRVGSRARRRALSKATSEYMSSDEVRAQEEAIRKNEQLSWEQRDKQLKELRQKLREEFAAKFDDTNVQQDELDRIASERAIAEAGREPLDDIIKDLQSQKKAAMRYGAVSDEDLKNDKYLKQNEIFNKNILDLTDELVQKQKELEDIKSDDTLDEKTQEKKIKAKQKEIDAINQEIQHNQKLIDNRVKLMELHRQEKEESKQTPEEKALLATEKLVGMKQSLAQAEENVAARKAEYESAKGTENEIKMLEALDNQIKKRDQIQEQIAATEKKIERLGQVTQKTEEAQDEVASTVDGTTSGEASGGLLGLIKEAVGEVGVGDLTKVEEILGKILAILSGNGVVGGTARNSEMDAKLARIKELEAKQQLANEQKKTAETVKQVENAKQETTVAPNVADSKAHKNVSKTQVYKDIQKSVDAFRTSELSADKEPLNAIKMALDELSKINDQNSQEYIEWQRKLGSALAAYGKKNNIENGKGYYDKVYAELGKSGVTVDPKLAITNTSGISNALVEKGLVTIKEKEAKAKQSEAKAEEKITEEKKEQEKIRFTRKEKKELNRLKSETKDYNPDETTGASSEFGGFATENTLRAILEVLGKISTSGVPKSGGRSGGTSKQENGANQDDNEMTELERRVGALKGKFKDAISVGYLDENNADLAAFNKQLDDIENSDGTIEQLEEMRKKALALGDVINKTVAKNKRMYSGTTEINAATRQRSNMEARGALDNADLAMVDEYNKAYDSLIAKHKEFAVAGTLYDPNNQKALQNMAIQVKDLGKQLEKSVAEAEQLQQLVENSGMYNGKQMGGVHQLTTEEMSNVEASMKSYLQSLNLGNLEHVKFDHTHQKLTATLRTSNKTVADLEVKYNDATGALYAYQKAERESLTGVPAFINGFKKKFNSIMQYLSMTMSIHQVLAELRKGVQYVREIDLALTELRKVTDETEETYDEFLKTAAKTGERLGSTISAVTEATATFAKLGYSMEQATEMAEAAIVYKNVGDNIASTEDAADSIISTMKGFRLEASESMEIVDRFNEVGNRFAITSKGIGEALRLSASALSEGGNSLDESIGLITAANEVVNDPSSVGTALKTLTLRLRGSKTELEEMGEDVSDMATTTSQLQAKLLALTGGQVDIMLDANTFKNSTQILREMADAWEDMNDIQRASALELMGGRLLPRHVEICA